MTFCSIGIVCALLIETFASIMFA